MLEVNEVAISDGDREFASFARFMALLTLSGLIGLFAFKWFIDLII
jgi:hypothetical protein